jgi:5-methylcytosine-specific restriction endonuclease McrA
VPVSEAIGAILAGAFVKVVVHTGVDITKVSHHGRHIPEIVRTAIHERDGYTCVRPGCGGTAVLEIHHYKVDHARGGPVAYWNLCTVCRHCHHLLTHGGHRLEGGPGNWNWIPPP